MSCMKAFAESVSEESGFFGEINPDVLVEALRQLSQRTIARNAKLRRAIRSIAGQSGSSMPIVVVTDGSHKPTTTGESWHWETSGGRRIYHPSAYSKVGWSNMHYQCSTRRIEVSVGWLVDHMHILAK